MFGDVLNGFPVLGHVKAVVHFAMGDTKNAGEAFFAASRTVAVMLGGALGAAGGLAGVVAGAAGAGFAVDILVSTAANKPYGLLYGVADIVLNIRFGNVPIKSVLETGLYVGADALSGFGGAELADLTKSVMKETIIEAAKPACQKIAVGSLTRSIAGRCGLTYPLAYNSQPPTSPRGGSSASGEYSNNRSEEESTLTTDSADMSRSRSELLNNSNPQFRSGQTEEDSDLTIFLKIFDVSHSNDINKAGINIFKNLKTNHKQFLKKMLNKLRINGYLEEVLETVTILFSKVMQMPQDVTFHNVVRLTQFVAVYIGEEVASHIELHKVHERITFDTYEQRRQRNTSKVVQEISQTDKANNIHSVFKRLHSQIGYFECESSFRHVISCVYLYYKHRVIPSKGEILSVPQFFGLVKSMIYKAKSLKEYKELVDPSDARSELVFDRVYSAFGRRIRLVLRNKDGTLEISSCYFLDVVFDGDSDNDEFIDANRKNKTSKKK